MTAREATPPRTSNAPVATIAAGAGVFVYTVLVIVACVAGVLLVANPTNGTMRVFLLVAAPAFLVPMFRALRTVGGLGTVVFVTTAVLAFAGPVLTEVDAFDDRWTSPTLASARAPSCGCSSSSRRPGSWSG
jgi:cytochrome b561